MKILLTFWVFILVSVYVNAQNTVLSGRILFLSSKKQPANGVKIQDKNNDANPDYSTRSGQFALSYPRKRPGDKVTLTIDTLDAKKQAIEVVDVNVLITRIPADKNDLIEIIVCKRG